MTTIIVPTAIVTGMGLIAAVILTVASKLMYVPVDERVAAIREVLPGANCGACGFAGCDDYAAAFTDNPGLSCSLCPVGGASVASQIAGIMGEEASSAEPQVAMVMCQGSFGVTRQIMEEDRVTSCKEAKMFYGGQWACRFGCLGLGDCYNVCKFDAITVDNGVAKINRDVCVGCGACTNVCPNEIISMVNKKNLVFVACKSMEKGAKTRKTCEIGCIGCMKCQKTCKFDAIKVENNVAKVDLDACKNCGMCEKECPTGAIVNYRKKKKPVKKAAETKPAAAEAQPAQA